jgi:hypothetical protein
MQSNFLILIGSLLLRLLIIGWLTKGDATTLPWTLSEEQVQQGTKHNPGWHQPDYGEPEDFSSHGVLIIHNHQRRQDVTKHRHKNDDEKQYGVKKATSIAGHSFISFT